MVNSSAKGGAFERKVGRMLSAWLTRGEDDAQLIRSVSSGGWSRRKVLQVGDLAPNGPRGEEFRRVFGVECKHRDEFEWRHVFTSGAPALMEWWEKHAAECVAATLCPLIVYRKNHHPLLVGAPSGAISRALIGTDLPAWPTLTVTWGPPDAYHAVDFVEWPVLEAADPDDVLAEGRTWLLRHSE